MVRAASLINKDMETTLSFFRFKVELTWSKIMALVVLVLAFVLDYAFDKQGQVFMFSLPFVVFLITGKQINDAVKEIKASKE